MMPGMWTVQRDHPGSSHSLRLRFAAGKECLSYADFLSALSTDADFRELFQDQLRAAPYTAFRWETPPLNSTNFEQPFECLLHDSPGLDVSADPSDFESYFQAGTEVVSFENLGGDALLVVPCPVSQSANYSHIAAFHRTAPGAQQHSLWIAVATTLTVTTAGCGKEESTMKKMGKECISPPDQSDGYMR